MRTAHRSLRRWRRHNPLPTSERTVAQIMDKAGQKGTGKWTVHSSLETGVPVTLIGESVFARCLSAMKDERVHASTILSGPNPYANFTKEVPAEGLLNSS